MLSIVGTIGKVAVTPPELDGANITQSSVRIRPGTGVAPDFLTWALQAPCLTRQYDSFRFGNAVQRLNIEHVRQLVVPLPPLAEQREICSRISTSMARLLALDVPSLASRLAALESSVRAKAFRGELVPQDPNDEPAAVLLDRIRNAPGDASAAPRPRSTRTPTRTAEPAIVEPPAPTPAHTQPQLTLDADALIAHTVAALWPNGPLDKDAAIRRLADHLRDGGLVSFQRLRADGPLYSQLADAIDAAVKSGHLDRPKRGQVRACKPDATAYTADDWRHALLAVLSPSPTDRDDAIRAAAEWARDNCGLEFTRLRADGHIVTGLRSALNSAIRAKLITRIDATRIARAPDSTADRQTTLFADQE
ncbi:MAG: restriction endonuclease subunit S [Myxococcales bacterium]|nr:restriction endonuclease subunit S [Myxococcales bacterium]